MKTTDKFLSAVVLAAAALCASCSTDDLASQRQQGQAETTAVSLTATVNDASTRAGMSKDDNGGSNAKFYWHNKDAILVQTKNADGAYSGTMFHTTDETGATTATFWGDALSGSTLGQYALYPYNENHKFTSDGITYNLPASYTYTTVDNGIFSKIGADASTAVITTIYRTNSTNIPMLGTVADGKVKFNYLGGLAVIRIDKMPCASGTLTVSADQQLSGNFDVSDLSSATIATTDTQTDADKQVAFAFSGATRDDVGVFYLPLATGDYTNVTINISSSDATTTQTVPYGALSVSCGNVQAISLTTDSKGNLRNIQSLGNNRYQINGHVFVDLGLPNGLLWAETNVGATKETDYGTYFAWGAIKESSSWSWDGYIYGTATDLTKYNANDAKTTLDADDDVAIAYWGAACRMPTMEEFAELINAENSSCSYTAEEGVNGYKVSGITTGHENNSIFLPAAGYRDGGSYMFATGGGYYWTTTLGTEKKTGGINLFFDGDNAVCATGNGHDRYCGLSVRPVADK